MMNPLPDPGLGVSKSLGASLGSSPGLGVSGDRRGATFADASILTTAAFRRSATSAKLTIVEAGAEVAGRTRSFAAGRGVAVDTTGVGVSPPARIRPTRNATSEL